jgi:hypothetical protein
MKSQDVYAKKSGCLQAQPGALARAKTITLSILPFTACTRAIGNLAGWTALCVLLALPAAARVHSNSMLPNPFHLHTADVDGDGIAEWVGYENDTSYGGYVLSIARTDFYATPLLTIDQRRRTTGNSAQVSKLFTGRFVYPGQESVCTVLNTGRVQCFLVFAGSTSADLYADQVGTSSWFGREILVGDFDGDGLDEVLLYDRWTAATELWKSNTSTGQFAPATNFAPGHVAADAGLIAGSPIVLVGNFGDWGDGRRDDLLVCNSRGQVTRYDARRDPSSGGTTFWYAFRTGAGVTSCNYSDVSVADVTGSGYESLVLRDSRTNTTRFLSMDSTGTLLPVDSSWILGSVNQGQIGPGDGFLIWAKMSRWAGEAGTDTRDDVFLFAGESVSRYDARYYSPWFTYTYWWGYTQWSGYVLSKMFAWAAL